MKTLPTAMSAFALASCFQHVDDSSIPARRDVLAVEAALARHPCVGDLNLWERNYRYSRKTGLFSPHSIHPDLDIIEFHLRRAGTIVIAPGVRVMRQDQGEDWPDNRTVQTIDGRYKIKGSQLDVAPCKPFHRA
jgi:hypothetical protein